MAGLYLDHNIGRRVTRLLRQHGQPVTMAREVRQERAPDTEILRTAAALGLVLVTSDRDFLGLHQVGMIVHAGILLVPERPRENAGEIVQAVLSLLGEGLPLPNELYRLTSSLTWVRE